VRLLLLSGVVLAVVVASLDLFQAVTGRRVSTKPSKRTDSEMRRQSAIAAAVLFACAVALLALASAS
jgi:hypothetical protein